MDVSRIPLTKKTSLIDYPIEELGGYDLYIVNGIRIVSVLPFTLYRIFEKHPCIFRYNFRSLLYPSYAVRKEKPLYYLYSRLYLPRFVKAADAIWVLNETDKIYFSKLCKKVYKIINYVDLDYFRPADKLKRFTVLFVGRFTYEKGLETLFNAIHLINKLNKKIDFVFIGSGTQLYENQLNNLRTSYRNVYWEKPIFDKRLVDYYAKSHVSVIPSILEGLPNVALESLASGTPIISSAISGLKDIILPRSKNFDNSTNCTGSVFPANDAVALTNEIVAWYNLWQERRTQYQRICENARNYAVQNLNETRFANEVKSMIEDVLQAK